MDSVHFFNIVKIHARRAVVAKSTNDSKCVQACSLAALVGSLGRVAAVWHTATMSAVTLWANPHTGS